MIGEISPYGRQIGFGIARGRAIVSNPDVCVCRNRFGPRPASAYATMRKQVELLLICVVLRRHGRESAGILLSTAIYMERAIAIIRRCPRRCRCSVVDMREIPKCAAILLN